MKKFITLSIALLAFTFSNAQETTKSTKSTKKTAQASLPKIDGAGMVFETETIDYGNIAINSDGNRKFTFTNNGNKPLIITNAVGSCGCTVPSYPKEPIMPGAKGVIGVKYDTSASRVGPISKTITVTSNAAGTPSKTLSIKGNVLADAPKS